MSRAFKIAIVGAGSVGFTRTLIRDIVERLVAVSGLPTRITATTDRAHAISSAAYARAGWRHLPMTSAFP
jgi:alpha-galactosidase